MAKGRSRRGSGGSASPGLSDRDRIIDAAMGLIAQHGWRRLSMAAIAAEAGVPILDLYRAFRSKPAILHAFSRRIDEAVLAAPLEGAGISATGLGGIVAVKLTAAAYLMTLRVWLRDDSPDLAPTMAALDRRLRGIERWFGPGPRAEPGAAAGRA